MLSRNHDPDLASERVTEEHRRLGHDVPQERRRIECVVAQVVPS